MHSRRQFPSSDPVFCAFVVMFVCLPPDVGSAPSQEGALVAQDISWRGDGEYFAVTTAWKDDLQGERGPRRASGIGCWSLTGTELCPPRGRRRWGSERMWPGGFLFLFFCMCVGPREERKDKDRERERHATRSLQTFGGDHCRRGVPSGQTTVLCSFLRAQWAASLRVHSVW